VHLFSVPHTFFVCLSDEKFGPVFQPKTGPGWHLLGMLNAPVFWESIGPSGLASETRGSESADGSPSQMFAKLHLWNGSGS